MILTVIIRDDAPFSCVGDCPSYRTVRIELTEQQEKILVLKKTHTIAGHDYYESISKAILE